MKNRFSYRLENRFVSRLIDDDDSFVICQEVIYFLYFNLQYKKSKLI